MNWTSFAEGIPVGIVLVFAFVFVLGRYMYYHKPKRIARMIVPMMMRRK